MSHLFTADELEQMEAADAVPIGSGAYQLVPKEQCPCDAFSIYSRYHKVDCQDRRDPEED
jgi:hypothetical protein